MKQGQWMACHGKGLISYLPFRLKPELPHLSPLLVAFFEGAAATWKRFTSEFAPGGLINEATTQEKDSAWMPPTNDANEGALGSLCTISHS